ncbi:MAG: hypothetical protein ACE14S_04165 [Candidatus Bathyarchaeia archaeon]
MSKSGAASPSRRSCSRSIARNVITSILCVILIVFQIFFPYFYYSSSPRGNPASQFTVGVHYVYDQDQLGQIYGEVSRIHSLGFKVIRTYLQCDPSNPDAYVNQQTDEFFNATEAFGVPVALAILNHETVSRLQYYLERWGSHLAYVQILNEPELSQSWDVGALFTDDEIFSYFQTFYNAVKRYNLPVQLYTNFEPGFILRTNVPIQLSKSLDFVGLDVYMQSLLLLSPNFIQWLQKLTGKEVVITEFGMSTSDDAAQSAYIIQGLNLFRSLGLRGCWLAYWNAAGTGYGIRGRLAEARVGDWIARNAV